MSNLVLILKTIAALLCLFNVFKAINEDNKHSILGWIAAVLACIM